jgi:hypothetical protein
MGNYASKGDSYTIPETDNKFALKTAVYTKPESDERFPAKDSVYTKGESDGKYAAFASSYTKPESDGRFPAKDSVYTKGESDGRFAPKGESYTKGDSDGRFAAKDSVYTKGDSDGKYAAFASSYTKGESDGRFAAKDSVYTKGDSDGKYAAFASSYTKGESDGRFAAKDSVYTKGDSDGKYAAFASSYTKGESDGRFAPKGESYTKGESDGKLQSFVTNNNLTDLKPLTMWCADGEFCKLPENKTFSQPSSIFITDENRTDWKNFVRGLHIKNSDGRWTHIQDKDLFLRSNLHVDGKARINGITEFVDRNTYVSIQDNDGGINIKNPNPSDGWTHLGHKPTAATVTNWIRGNTQVDGKLTANGIFTANGTLTAKGDTQVDGVLNAKTITTDGIWSKGKAQVDGPFSAMDNASVGGILNAKAITTDGIWSKGKAQVDGPFFAMNIATVGGEMKVGGADVNSIKSPDGTTKINQHGIMFGGANSNKELNSAQISAGVHVPNSLNIVGMSSGKEANDRRVDVWAEGGLNLYGKLIANGRDILAELDMLNKNSIKDKDEFRFQSLRDGYTGDKRYCQNHHGGSNPKIECTDNNGAGDWERFRIYRA